MNGSSVTDRETTISPTAPVGDGPADAAGGLVVSGGGTSMIATDELLTHAALMRVLHTDAVHWQTQLERIRLLDSTPAPGWSTDDVGWQVFEAAAAIADLEQLSGELADSLIGAAEGYGEAERMAELFARVSGAAAGQALARLLPFLLVMSVPLLTAGALAWLLGGLGGGGNLGGAGVHKGGATAQRGGGRGAGRLGAGGHGGAPTGFAAWLARHPRALTNPLLVHIVRVLVSSIDDVGTGAIGLPLPLALALGDDGLRVLGVSTSAAGILGLARPFGPFRETGVAVGRAGESTQATPPAGLGDLADRIPSVSDTGPQVRIERYGDPAAPSWVVYIGGTAEWSPVAADQPWDLTSNVAAVAEHGSGSYRAVELAMRDAGVQPSDPVVQVGHSQGGLIAAQLAASGEFNTVMVATFGAPAGQVDVPPEIPMVQVAHSDDLVPALGGAAREVTDAGNAHLLVRREVYAIDEPPTDSPLPAHTLVNYRETGRQIDDSPEPRLLEWRNTLSSIVGTVPGESTLWHGTRLPAE